MKKYKIWKVGRAENPMYSHSDFGESRDLGINECTIRSNLSARQKTAKGIKFEKL